MAPVVILLALLMTCAGQQLNLVYRIFEEQQRGTVVANIAEDLIRNLSFTAEELKNQRYSIFSKDADITKKFKIDDRNGIITTGIKLDREVECERKLECQLSFDVGFYYKEPGSSQVMVGEKIIRIVVHIDDINDNAPTFPERYILRNISEAVPIGHLIPVSPAVDLDMTGNNSVDTYLLFPKDGPFSLEITENPSGVRDVSIRVRQKLDREKRDFYKLTLIAKDGGTPRRSGYMDINVTIADVNDVTPHFNIKTFTVIVQEDIPVGSTILTLSASDEDTGPNSELYYYISSRASPKVKNMFMVEIDTGELYPIKNLDYETQKQYEFPVEVRDSGNPVLSSEVYVVVNVTDINDNPPKIILKQQLFNLSEATKTGTSFTVFTVSDDDAGDTGRITCHIGDPRFQLEKMQFSYHKIYLRQMLDYEVAKIIDVNITCLDSDSHPLRSSVTFTVQVLDVNDNPPYFYNHTIYAHISENNEIGDIITTLKAYDPDGPGFNIMQYAILGKTTKASLDLNTGVMRAQKVFDCETESSFEVNVIAIDALNPLLNSTVLVSVVIDDVNDMPPRFTQHRFEFNITENLPAYTVCGQVTAVDLDSSDNFVFSFRDLDAVRNVFKLDSRNGEIRSATKLTREQSTQYNFGVIVLDPENESFRSTADVVVYIMEDLDRPPLITFPNRLNNSIEVPYNSGPGTLITVITATDDGRDGQVMLTFTIEQGNEDTLFLLNAITGEITLARDLTESDAGDHEILIAVHDNGHPRHTTYAYLTIHISASAAGAGFEYLPIVISIVLLTIILGLIIFLGILCAKKRERKRKEREKKMEQGMKVYTLPQGDDPDVPRYTSHSALSRKPDTMARLQVFEDIERDSYKFRDDVMDTSFQSEEDDKISDLFHIYGHGYDLGLPRKHLKYRQGQFTKVDDGASDVSVATDSGRGASDEDINSNRALSFLHTESDQNNRERFALKRSVIAC